MDTITTNEGLMNNSSQPQKGNKGSISDLSTLMIYDENLGLLLKDGVKETIQQIVEFHKRNNSGKNIIDIGEGLLKRLEYISSEKKKERIIKFLKWRLDDELQQIDWMKTELSDVALQKAVSPCRMYCVWLLSTQTTAPGSLSRRCSWEWTCVGWKPNHHDMNSS